MPDQEPKVDMSHADKFVWKDGDITITSPTPEENQATKERYKEMQKREREAQEEE